MVKLLKSKDEYWSKSDAFLLPLTGIKSTSKFPLRSYLYWNEYSIDDYQLTLSFEYENYDDFLDYCRHNVLPILDKNTIVTENYDIEGRSIFVIDIAEWAMDIEMFVAGKYSKFSKNVKLEIEKYHTFDVDKIPIHIYGVLYPNRKMKLLDYMTPMEYMAEHYGMNLEDVERIGEIGSTFNQMDETLYTDIKHFC